MAPSEPFTDVQVQLLVAKQTVKVANAGAKTAL